MPLLRFCQWLEHTGPALAIRESTWGYGLLIAIHVLGLGLFLGTVMMVDLRLFGHAIRTSPVSDLVRRLLPWTRAGFATMAASGLLLLFTEAAKCYQSPAFRLKLGFIALAGINVWVFHRRTYPEHSSSAVGAATPWTWKIAGGLSILFWIGALAAGRAVGYAL
jgi:hypothetical protein